MDIQTNAYTYKGIEKITNDKRLTNLKQKYLNQDSTIDALVCNILTGENTIIYGKGGYGKSQIVKDICKALGIPTSVIVCNSNMTTDDFIGPINLKKLYHGSTYEHDFSNTPFMVEGVLVLEEFADLNPRVANVLKDIIEEKGYRHKDNIQLHKIKAIIAIGNKNPKEIAVDESSKALYNDRFISHISMDWTSHPVENYIALFKAQQGEITPEIKFTAQMCSKHKVSPRIALSVLRRVIYGGINTLKSVHAFKGSNLKVLEQEYYDNTI